MNVVLFALTGFGNNAIDVLINNNCNIVALFTRKEYGPYPYYNVMNISEYANINGIKVYEKYDWDLVSNVLSEFNIDLILSCTYHRIIPMNILDFAKISINIHPSLLPLYKGRNPVRDVINNNERCTGISAHIMIDSVDSGEILIQKKIDIEKNDTESCLRKKLASLSGDVVDRLVKEIV